MQQNSIMDIKCLIVVTFWGMCIVLSQKTIPEYLRECYENTTFHGPRLPMNYQILIDIVRKAEIYSGTSMDMRTITTSLLHRFKFDGIEYYSGMRFKDGVLPFGGTGSQRSKNRLIEELITGNPLAFPIKALNLVERCFLHRAISNTVWEHEEASKDKLCIEGVTEKLSDKWSSGEMKMCPIEYGVVLTPFGTIAPGSVIAAIAASLQPQNVTIKNLIAPSSYQPPELTKVDENFIYNEDEVDLVLPKNQMALDRSMWLNIIQESRMQIDNVWIATIAGDLAEMAIYQGPIEGKRMVLGSTGFWNSSMQPSIYYLTGRDGTFDATRAEIIGGIDGLIIAEKLPIWIEKFHTLRLSQILDMYYSNVASTFDPSTRACDRGKTFWHVSPRSLMEEQTYATSQILAYRNSIAYMEEDVLKNMVNYAVNEFNSYTINHLFNELHCHNIDKIYPRIEFLVAFDGAWSQHYTADFLSVMVEDFDVSIFGSKIGIIHGNTGDWLLNVTDSPARAHLALANINNITWPSSMNFEKVLSRASSYLDDCWREKRKSHAIGNLGQVIIFLAPRTRFNTIDQQMILKLIDEFRAKHPDVHIIYYVSESNAPLFREFLLKEEDHLITSSNINDLNDVLLSVSRILRPTECGSSVDDLRDEIEDYVSPKKSVLYRLHPHWRRNTKKVTLTIHSVGYGTIEICTWNQRRRNVRKDGMHCQDLSGHSDTKIVDYANCDESRICNTTYYEIKGISSRKQCAEMDCRTPDHIRFIMRVENLHCSRAPKNSSFLINTISVLFTIFVYKNFLFVFFLHK